MAKEPVNAAVAAAVHPETPPALKYQREEGGRLKQRIKTLAAAAAAVGGIAFHWLF